MITRWAHPRRKEICINRNFILRCKKVHWSEVEDNWLHGEKMDGCGDRVFIP